MRLRGDYILPLLTATVLAISGSALFTASAQAKCGGGNHKRVIDRVGDVRIYRVNSTNRSDWDDRVYICASRYGDAIRLGNHYENDYRRLTTNGDFAAFVRTYENSGDGADSESVEVVNLRTQRWSEGARVTDNTVPRLRACDFPAPGQFCYFTPTGLLRLTPTGSVAFTAQVSGDDQRTVYGVYRYEYNAGLTRQTQEAVGHVRKREMKTLFVRNNLMHWHGYGRLRSAYIR